MILHDLKVATRNLMKYRLQTLISVVSIAIGIVTLSLAHSVMNYFRLPSIYDQPYRDRAYKVQFKSISEGENQRVTEEILRAVKGNGGLRNAEKIAVYNGIDTGVIAEFHLSDSTVRKGQVSALLIDPEYPGYAGMRSVVTGKNIRGLKAGEAIIGEEYAKSVFGESSPLGAVQCRTGNFQTIPVTIVDVYKSQPFIDDKRSNGRIYFCLSDNIEDHMPESYFYASGIRVVLKKGSNEQKLIQEINTRVEPLGLNVKISKVLDDESIKEYFIGRTFVYIISSLILLAAVIGFLRMQIQLFRMRKREIALRIVNGASRIRLFGMLVTETAISILMSVSVAFILSILLQNFLDKRFNNFFSIPVYNIWSDSLIIGFGLLCVCCLIVWIVIKRIGYNDDGLSANMRRGRNHVFRNVMLGIQIFISMVFVCGTFCLANGAAKILDAYNIPENDDFYKKCLYLRPDKAENPERLIDEFRRLTDLEKMAVWDNIWYSIKDFEDNPRYKELSGDNTYFNFFQTNDSAMPSILGLDVTWFNKDVDRNQCLLLSEKLYDKFKDFGLLEKNTLTVSKMSEKNSDCVLPIAGTYKKTPYDQRNESLIAIAPDIDISSAGYLLIPRKGRGKALARSAEETVRTLEPATINKMVFNYRMMEGALPEMVEAVRAGGWILGIVSLIICAMSIFSTISLDTRSRRKEVAIRKVNGAKEKDIYLMFGKLYLILIAVTSIFVIPVSMLFNSWIMLIVKDVSHDSALSSSVMPVIMGIALVILLIIIIIGYQIHKVVIVDPSKIIAKE